MNFDSIIKPFRYLRSDDFSFDRSHFWWRVAGKIPGMRTMLRRRYIPKNNHLGRDVFGIHFASPIGLAAGYDRDGRLIDTMGSIGFGFVEVGSITPHAQLNTSHPTLFKLKGDHAMLYRGETDSKGVEEIIRNIKRRQSRTVVGCNLLKSVLTPVDEAPKDYLRMFRSLYQWADYFTINLCDNTSSHHYLPTDREEILRILNPLFEFRRGQNNYIPILIKISPDLSDEQIDLMCDIMIDTPLDGIVACGGSVARHNIENSASQLHTLGRTAGIISGSPLRERALEVVRRIYRRSRGYYPIIGCGGISTTEDAYRMLQAGASLVQIGSEFIYGGAASIKRITQDLEHQFTLLEQAHERTAIQE